MENWQPISSAPRDGKKIIIKTLTGTIVEDAYWHYYVGDNNTPAWSGFVTDLEVDGKQFYVDVIYPKFWKSTGK